MSFEMRIPHPFTPNGVRTYAVAAAGVYGLSNAREWIYVGQSDNIQNALLEHLRTLDSAVLRWAPSGFVFETCVGEARRLRQDCLVLEYAPICNSAEARRGESALRKRLHAQR
jgi:hypothetical protein